MSYFPLQLCHPNNQTCRRQKECVVEFMLTSVLSIVFKRGQIKLKYTVRLIELDKYA